MADSLEERVRNTGIQDSADRQQALPRRHSNADSIDDIAEQAEPGYWHNPNPNTIDAKFELDKKRGFFGKIWDVVKYVPVIGAQAALFGAVVPLSSAITASGFVIGAYFQARKEGKKYSWRRFIRELYFGNLIGVLEYGLFKVPETITKAVSYFGQAGFLPKVAKWATIEALIVPPVLSMYNSIAYIKNEMGWGRFFSKVLSFRWRSLFKEIYQKAIKKKLAGDIWDVMKYIAPLHFIQFNYHPNVQTRMAQSVLVNNPIFRYMLGRKRSKEKDIEQSQGRLSPAAQEELDKYRKLVHAKPANYVRPAGQYKAGGGK